jgi:hypothetical protein
MSDVPKMRVFRLTPADRGVGIACDANGLFVGGFRYWNATSTHSARMFGRRLLPHGSIRRSVSDTACPSISRRGPAGWLSWRKR